MCVYIYIYKNTAILVQSNFYAIKLNREETELAPFGCIRDTVGRPLEVHVKNRVAVVKTRPCNRTVQVT